ncbi:hypothetical protein MYIN104542_12120 [Mycobacterium intermedium]
MNSGIDAAAKKMGSAFEKSSEWTRGSIRIWSMTLTPGVTMDFIDAISAALEFSSGKSPMSVIVLPLRLIDSSDNGGPGVLDGPLVGSRVGTLPLGPAKDVGRP